MIFSDKNMTPFDGEIIKELEEGLIIADGEKPKLITKNITANNTYNSSSDNADGYNKVIVNVANSYSQADNGKVVSNQELVTQTAYPTEITENDTYDTTNYNSITVNISGGGGETFEVNIVYGDDENITPDKTYAETIAAYNNGDTIRINMAFQIAGMEPFTVTNLGCGVYDGTIMMFFDFEEFLGEQGILYLIWSNPEIYDREWFGNSIPHRKL